MKTARPMHIIEKKGLLGLPATEGEYLLIRAGWQQTSRHGAGAMAQLLPGAHCAENKVSFQLQ